jgi:GntR family transcriptional repressor for pyruvate dehydrogenase complex
MNVIPGPTTRTETVATILRDEILSGQYRSGERLPSERDLCERFGVSRGAVREALKQLQQLGIASIQHGGARVVPIEDCTLDVLGPLLDLNEIPDPKLVDEVMHMIGVLMREAASAAIRKASAEQLDAAQSIADEILAAAGDPVRQFEAVRALGEFYVSVADHLVLRLMINGLTTSFMARMIEHDPMTTLEPDVLIDPVRRIRQALIQRNAEELGMAMQDMNRVFRDSAQKTLQRAVQQTARNVP